MHSMPQGGPHTHVAGWGLGRNPRAEMAAEGCFLLLFVSLLFCFSPNGTCFLLFVVLFVVLFVEATWGEGVEDLVGLRAASLRRGSNIMNYTMFQTMRPNPLFRSPTCQLFGRVPTAEQVGRQTIYIYIKYIYIYISYVYAYVYVYIYIYICIYVCTYYYYYYYYYY